MRQAFRRLSVSDSRPSEVRENGAFMGRRRESLDAGNNGVCTTSREPAVQQLQPGGIVRPTLVLGVGNLLLQDDGVGLRMVEELSREPQFQDQFEFVDGGTQGIALLGYFEGRTAAMILDAVALGEPPGTVHVLRGEAFPPRAAATAHEGNALQLLALARFLGHLPEEVVIVGIEPERVQTGIGLSQKVEGALPEALGRAREILEGQYVPGGTRKDY